MDIFTQCTKEDVTLNNYITRSKNLISIIDWMQMTFPTEFLVYLDA